MFLHGYILFISIICTCPLMTTYPVEYSNQYIINIDGKDLSSVEKDLQLLSLKQQRKVLPNLYIFTRSEHDTKSISADIDFLQILKSCCNGRIIDAEQVVESVKQLWPEYPLHVIDTGGDDNDHTPKPTEETLPYTATGVSDVWSKGITGKGVVIGITDVGIDVNLKDLSSNIAIEHCFNFVSNTSDVTAEYCFNYPEMYKLSDHGSNCAGLVAALRNDQCGTGIAYGARIAGLKIFWIQCRDHGPVNRFSDAYAAAGLAYKNGVIDIYSNSWGTTADFDVHYYGLASRLALKTGVTSGRKGKGSIYVFPVAALADGYNNNPYSITVNEVLAQGKLRNNSLFCACTITSTYTTEMKTTTSYRHSRCTTEFTGTSAATALISGSIALTLEANYGLTWRDVQNLIVESSEKTNAWNHSEFKANGAGKYFHSVLGFGILNETRMVKLAENWTPVKKQACQEFAMKVSETCEQLIIPQQPSCTTTAVAEMDESTEIDQVEHVTVKISYRTLNEKAMSILLRSPNGTESSIMHKGQSKSGEVQRQNVTLLSVHFWGETVPGVWTLILEYCHKHPHIKEESGNTITFCGTTKAHKNHHPEVEDTLATGRRSPQHKDTVKAKSNNSRTIEDHDGSNESFAWWAIVLIVLVALIIIGLAVAIYRKRVRVKKCLTSRFSCCRNVGFARVPSTTSTEMNQQ